jgi:hypothetical protein
LLSTTLFLLVRVGTASRWIWLLPAVCALWVNVDEWFFLGPAAIALFLIGELLQRRLGEAPGAEGAASTPPSLRALALVLAASVAACLVNPYHVRAFTLPLALDPAILATSTPRDTQFHHLFLSPLEKLYYLPTTGLSVAGLAFFPLLVLGLLSFALAYSPTLPGLGWRWWRVLLWVAFLALAGWNVRCIPFFAVVAGPITTLNFLDFADRKLGANLYTEHRWQRWAVSGRLLTLIVFVLLGAAGVTGWLQALPQYTRPIGWGVDADPGLRRAALQVMDWHDQDLISGEEHWLNTSPEAANYFAWFCADERGRPIVRNFFDQRLTLFPTALEDLTTLRRSLAGEDAGGDRSPDREPPPPAWRKVLAGRQVRFVAFHSYDLARSRSTLARLYNNPDEWQPCYLQGRTALFAWRDPRQRPMQPWVKGLAESFDDLAFGSDAVRAPDEHGRPPEVRWWHEFVRTEVPPSIEAGSAMQNWSRFEAMSFSHSRNNQLLFMLPMAVRLVGSAAAPGGPVVNGTWAAARLNLLRPTPPGTRPPPIDQILEEIFRQHMLAQDEGPPSSAYLAIRDARKAIHDNPDDISSYLVLAQSFLCLRDNTRERVCVAQYARDRVIPLMPNVSFIRQSQIAGALQRVLALNPRPEVQMLTHYLLANRTFIGPEFLEARIHHQRDYLRLARSLGQLVDAPSQQFGEHLVRMESELKKAESQLKKNHDQYVVTAGSKRLLDKVSIALRNGLAETALDVLLKADPKDLSDPRLPGQRPGATMLVDLLLRLGRLDDARTALHPEAAPDEGDLDKRVFGIHPQTRLPAYDWLRVQLAAAAGDYEVANEVLGEIIADQKKNLGVYPLLAGLDILPAKYPEGKDADLATCAGHLVGHILLREAPQAAGMPWQVLRHIPLRLHQPHLPKRPGMHFTLLQGTEAFNAAIGHEADLWALRAWLALEHGRIDRARDHAGKVMKLADYGQAAPGIRHIAAFRCLPLTQLCLERIDRRNR